MIVAWLKVLHVAMVMAWMAGSFFLVRMLIYHAEALQGSATPDVMDLLTQSARRVTVIILVPAMLVSVGAGLGLTWFTDAWMAPWWHVKMWLVLLLIGYQGWMEWIRRQLMKGYVPLPPSVLRVANEWPFVAMLGVLVAVYTRMPHEAMAVAGGGSVLLLWVASRRYRPVRSTPSS